MLRQVAVVGAGSATPQEEAAARAVGAGLGAAGVVVVTGGLGGVMAAASAGAVSAGGLTVGLLPGDDPRDAGPDVRVVVPTGLGEARNALVVRSASVVVAVGGGWGTLSELALARRADTPVVALGSWDLPGVEVAADPDDAVRRALAHLDG